MWALKLLQKEAVLLYKDCLYVAVWWPWVEDELPEYNREMALILMGCLEHHGTCCTQDSMMKNDEINAHGTLRKAGFSPVSHSACFSLSLFFKGLKWVGFRVLQENY